MGTPSNSDLSLQSTEDDQCIFMPSSLLEHPENLDDWLTRHGHFLITNDGINESLIDNKLDPLLNQTNACLDRLTDGESEPEIASIQNVSYATSSKNYKATENGEKQNDNEIGTKINILEEEMNSGIKILLSSRESKMCVLFCDKDDKEIFPQCVIASLESGGRTYDQKEKQSVVELSRVVIANDINVAMPRLLTDMGLRLFLCPLNECNQVFLRLGSAKLHALVHMGHKPYQCTFPDCTWAFHTPFKLKRHQETHAKKKEFICPITHCLRRFTTVYNLNNHKRLHERPADLPCPVLDCGQKFQTARARERHLKGHNRSEAPFHCPVSNCNKSFFLNTALTVHARTHTHKESELRCKWPNCGKIFEQPCRLKEHARKHTGQRPYCCTFEDCKWSFPTASKLKRHQSIHTNDRKFHCTIGTCTKSFLRSEHLKEHTLTHIGQRMFQCEVCAASFLGKSTLYLHVNKCHPEQDACARALPFLQNSDKPSADTLLEQAIQSLGVPSDMILGTGLLPEEPLDLLENEHFSTVNLRDLD